MEKITLSILGLTEELTVNLESPRFEDIIIQLFEKCINEDYFCFNDEMDNIFIPNLLEKYPLTGNNDSFIIMKRDDSKLKEHIISKIRGGNLDEQISPFSKMTVFDFIKLIFASILHDDLGDSFYLTYISNFSPTRLIEEKTKIKLKGISIKKIKRRLSEKMIVSII